MRLARGGERKTEMCERLIFFFFGDDHMATSSYLLRNRYRFGCLLFRESLLCNSESLENLLEWRHAWTFPSGFSQSHSMCVLQPAHSCELAGEMVTLRCFCEICSFFLRLETSTCVDFVMFSAEHKVCVGFHQRDACRLILRQIWCLWQTFNLVSLPIKSFTSVSSKSSHTI